MDPEYMMQANTSGDNKDLESEIWNAISAFEQILEALPNDRASLEALSHAYGQIGDHAKAKDYSLRLADAIIEEGDFDSLPDVALQLNQYADDDAVEAMLKRIAAFTSPMADDSTSSDEDAAASGEAPGQDLPDVDLGNIRASFNMGEELALAWNLLQGNEITQEEYSGIVQDLTEMSATEFGTTVSVLHVLEARKFKNLEKIIVFLAKEFSTPVIHLSSFDLQYAPVTVLPMDYMAKCGAMIFEFMGKDALAVVMNPYDKQLRKDVETIARRKCHFFLTLPTEFDSALNKISQMIVERTTAESESAKK